MDLKSLKINMTIHGMDEFKTKLDRATAAFSELEAAVKDLQDVHFEVESSLQSEDQQKEEG